MAGAYKGKDIGTISVQLHQITKFSEDVEKSKMFVVGALNYGIYISVKGMTKEKKFSNILAGLYVSKDLFPTLAKLFSLSARAVEEAVEFKYEIDTKKGSIYVKGERHDNAIFISLGITEKETNKTAQFHLPLRDAIKDEKGGKKISQALVELIALEGIFASISASSNVKWENHATRVHLAAEGAGGGNKGGSNNRADDGDEYPY